MESKIVVLVFAMFLTVGHGIELRQSLTAQYEPTNYDLSRKQSGFGLRDIWDFLVGGGYGNYPHYGSNYPTGSNYPNYPTGPGLYPSGSGYPGQYPGSNYNQYPGNQVDAPGAHPGCPLCDSSVYSYCSYKQNHDACCCENPNYLPYNCRKADCKFLYANTCQEYNLISSCCCIDVQKSNVIDPVVQVPVVPVVA